MAKFFTYLNNNNLFDDWAPALDWYLATNSFSKDWTENEYVNFSNKIKKIPSFPKRIVYSDGEKVKGKTKHTNYSCVRITKYSRNNEFSYGLIIHIRNALAHGRIEFYKLGGYLLLKDFYNGDIKKQTAYINLKFEVFLEIYKEFLKINNDIKRSKK